MKILRVVAAGNLADQLWVAGTTPCLEARGHSVRVWEIPSPPEVAGDLRFGPIPDPARWSDDGPWDVIELPQECIRGLESAPRWLPAVVRAPALLGAEWDYRVATDSATHLLPGWWKRLRFPSQVLRPWSDGLRAAKAVVCSNEPDRRLLTERIGIAPSKVILAGAGTDDDHFGCGEHRLSEGTIPRLLWVGPWSKRRGNETVARAFRVLRAEMPQIHLRILAPGADPKAVQTTFAEADWDGVEVETDPSPSVRRSQYAQHDILIATSPAERFDPTVLEAAASGMALVLRDPDGPAPGFQPSTEFLAVPENNPDAVAAAVARLINDPDLATRLRFAAVAKARTLPWSAVAQRFEEGYKRAVEPVS